MRSMIAVIAVVVLSATTAACHGFNDDVDPSAVQASAAYPCGVIGEVCSLGPGGDWHGATCCWEGEACGGTPGCPVGKCCDDRPLTQGPEYGRRVPDAGALTAPPHRERPWRVNP